MFTMRWTIGSVFRLKIDPRRASARAYQANVAVITHQIRNITTRSVVAAQRLRMVSRCSSR